MKTQDDSNIEKRLLLAILLSMAILFITPYVYNTFFPEPPAPAVEEAVMTAPEPEEGNESAELGANAAAVEETTTAETAVDVVETAAEQRRIVVESESLILEFNSVGAVVEQAQLKGMGLEEEVTDEAMFPVELPEGASRPLGLRHADPELNDMLAHRAWEVEGVSSDTVKAPVTLTFRYRNRDIEALKTVEIPVEGYEIKVRTKLTLNGRGSPYGVSIGVGIGPEGSSSVGDFANPNIAYLMGEGVERYDESDLSDGDLQMEIVPRWVAVDSQYFALVALEPAGMRNLRMERREWVHADAAGDEITAPLVGAFLGLNGESEFRYFIGPKSTEELSRADESLGNLIDYGWFGILVKPLLVGLKWIYSYIGNYGWSIIILTFLINLALFPVRYKQMASMKKMSALQPKLKSIQDRYKRMKRDDPRRQQMNTEIMGLYKEHGVNPLGGCLPLLLQMPILFAFYQMLAASIELRGAPFIFWIQDLSKADPYYVTPIVMGATMVAQQKMTPATGDPSQRKMMMMLPIVFTFFFLNVSSGLAIYFLFSNVFAMLFQVAVQRLKSDEEPEEGSRKSKSKKRIGKGAE